jgi:putative spermidine/putrescine transport system permease protein
MTDRLRRLLGLYALIACAISVLPVIVIVIESFTATDYVVFPPPALSLKWYAEVAKRDEFLQSAELSLVVAVIAGCAATVLGTLVALALTRHRFLGRAFFQALFMAPLSLPGIIFGLALLQFFARHDLPRDFTGLLIGHTIITTPFAVRFVTVALQGVGRDVELAAESLGANRWAVFRRITLPLIRPGVAASLVFAFILSFDDVAVALFLATPTATTLPVRIYTYIDQNYDPLVTAVSSFIVLAAFLALGLIERTIGIGRLFGLR